MQCCWHGMVVLITNILSQSHNVLVHFCSSKHWHFLQRGAPSIVWVVDILVKIIGSIGRWICAFMLLPFGVQSIRVWFYDIFVSSSVNVFLDSEKEANIYVISKSKHAHNNTKQTVNKPISHLLTSSAFVLRPFAGSSLHRNQNFNSSFLKGPVNHTFVFVEIREIRRGRNNNPS